jgi:hypothetical protein
VGLWELVTLTLERNRCQGGRAGARVLGKELLAIGWRSCILSLGALFGGLVSSESGMICLGRIT